VVAPLKCQAKKDFPKYNLPGCRGEIFFAPTVLRLKMGVFYFWESLTTKTTKFFSSCNMNKIEIYRKYIKQLIEDYASYGEPPDGVERQIIFDTVRDHYQLFNVGWHKDHWIYGCSMHFDIKNGKIWIQHNATEFDIGEDLVDMGVVRDDIVLGFQPPYMRKFTNFGCGTEDIEQEVTA